MSFEKQMYEVKEKWESNYFSSDDTARIKYIKELIPKTTKSVLDVGCGNGILVNYLAEHFGQDFERICATDRSKTSLSFVNVEKYEADIKALPFDDDSFDTVLCLEVIEHLPQDVYKKALNEIQRVCSKHLIISVPYKEDLNYSKVRCKKCLTEFNPFYHMHSFDDKKLNGLFQSSSITCERVHKVGSYKVPYFKGLKKYISRTLHPEAFPQHCICPMCGYNEFSKLKNKTDAQSNVDTNHKGLSRFWPHRSQAKWIVAVYNK